MISSPFHKLSSTASTSWFDRSYAVDWTVVIIFYVLGGIIDELPVYQREYSVDDPTISFPHKHEQISSFANNVAAMAIPSVFIFISALFNGSTIELHHGLLGLFLSRGLCRFITEFLKNRVGRLRPDFLARCQWSEFANHCTGKLKVVADGHKSFPSGHSSTMFAGMGFLFFWLAGKTAAWCFSEPLPARSLRSTRTGRIAITLLPIFLASWVAITRVEDYRHHKEDVIAGSLIGLFTSSIGYFSYWPNPFSSGNYRQGINGKPKVLYSDDNDLNNNNYGLAGLDEDGRLPV